MVPFKTIMYDLKAKFNINPIMIEPDITLFNHFAKQLKYFNCIGYNKNLFFWWFDKYNNCIIVNPKSNCTGYDIFDQLCTMAHWLYNNNYNLRGTLSYQTENIIGTITANGNILHHYITFTNYQSVGNICKQNISICSKKNINYLCNSHLYFYISIGITIFNFFFYYYYIK